VAGPLIEAIQEACHKRNPDFKGTVTRVVVVAESMHEQDGRSIGYFARAFDGTGLYPWETLGMMEYFLASYTTDVVDEARGEEDDSSEENTED
jgi:hypothetical protein